MLRASPLADRLALLGVPNFLASFLALLAFIGGLSAATGMVIVEATIGTYHMPLLAYFRRTYGFAAGDHPVSESVAARSAARPTCMACSRAAGVIEARRTTRSSSSSWKTKTWSRPSDLAE